MDGFFESYSSALWVVSVTSSILFGLKTLLLFFGFGGEIEADTDVDVDVDTDVDVDVDAGDVDVDAGDAGDVGAEGGDSHVVDHLPATVDGVRGVPLRLFTLHGILSFFMVGGWTGYVVLKNTASYSHIISIILSSISGLVVGFLMMWLCAVIFRSMRKLESSGNVNMKKAIGMIGEVYLTVPERDGGEGKVNLDLGGKIADYTAISRDEKPIESGVKVRVVELVGEDTFVVQRVSEENV